MAATNPLPGNLGFGRYSGENVPLKVDSEGRLIVAGGTIISEEVSIPDGNDVVEGTLADAAVTGDNSGTVSGKLRGLTTIFADVWDSLDGWLKVSIQNTSVPTAPAPATSVTLSNVAASATVVTLLTAAARTGAIFFNDSSSAAYIKLGDTASTTSFTYKVFGSQTVVLDGPIYQGDITAIWDSAAGNMRVTEIV